MGCLLYPLSFVLTLNCASTEEGRDSNRCLVTILLSVAAGTVLFGFFQVSKAYATQTAEYLRNV